MFPEIFANGESDPRTLQIKRTSAIACSKISSLIKNLIVWQALLAILTHYLTLLSNQKRIIDCLAGALWKANDQNRIDAFPKNVLQGFFHSEFKAGRSSNPQADNRSKLAPGIPRRQLQIRLQLAWQR